MKIDRASDTAVLIARSLLLLDATPKFHPLLPEHSARLTRILLNTAQPAGWFEFCLRLRWTRALLFSFERFFLPGIFLHYHTRKLRLAEFVSDAYGAGCHQLVVLGAGLDTLAWRQIIQSDMRCFELDHPATQAIKRRAFQNEPRVPILIAANLVHASPTELLREQPLFDPSLPVTIVAEGLLMYLSAERVSELFVELSTFAAPGSRFAFTFMETKPGHPIAFHNARGAVNSWLRVRQEPFRWGLARTELAGFAANHGWHLTYLSSPEELRSRLLAPHGLATAPLAIGESIAFAQKTGSSPS
jgi:methyltransferase (TIGR00027 family)